MDWLRSKRRPLVLAQAMLQDRKIAAARLQES